MSVNGWMDKENVYIYTHIYLAVCNNMDETGGPYAKWNKPAREKTNPA